MGVLVDYNLKGNPETMELYSSNTNSGGPKSTYENDFKEQ